jgi:hypothetical protein
LDLRHDAAVRRKSLIAVFEARNPALSVCRLIEQLFFGASVEGQSEVNHLRRTFTEQFIICDFLKAFPEGVSSNEISVASKDEAGSLSQCPTAPDSGIAQR